MIIAVDGPSASGKGTLARALARELKFHYLDTGAIYRMVGLSMLQSNKDVTDVKAAVQFATTLEPSNFEDGDLRTEKVASITSQVAAIPQVRAALLQFQRDFAKRKPGTVLDGRDIGTVVCPEADLKFFVVASPEVRALRRLNELTAKGESTDIKTVLAEIMARDERDSKRDIAPTIAARDAIVIDTSDLTIAEALEVALEQVRLNRPSREGGKPASQQAQPPKAG